MDARSIVACNNIETEESNGGYQLSQGSVVLDGSDSPFIQPGMTGQESANLLSASVLHKQSQHHSMLLKSNISDPTSKLIKYTPAAYRHDPTHSTGPHTFRNEANPELNLLPVHT
ncbi:hypothetical protein COCVIDRAFT_39279 [Bipolaris victoriae FI3]|uniref:Uncharacterized protein n=1 Tax=Bipolaris victoriae (strain FI3) TaxID=930091 RepID=W7EM04_BIPV3|nr:hypothetical protein COCVIDRAFT_39279 [Bipolaris victoriae FI3]